jgi:hypothetical protein
MHAPQYEAMFAQLAPEAEHGQDAGADTRLVLEVGEGGRYAGTAKRATRRS